MHYVKVGLLFAQDLVQGWS